MRIGRKRSVKSLKPLQRKSEEMGGGFDNLTHFNGLTPQKLRD